MRRLTSVLFFLFFAAFAALSATQLLAGVIPPIGLAPGSPYQLVFVTSDAIQATSPIEATYNSFVGTEAALSPTLPEASWNAITSTADGTDADVNAPSGGLPVYNTRGQLVAPATSGIYTFPIINAIQYDQFGNQANEDPNADFNFIWTGTALPGLTGSGTPLGTSTTTFAETGSDALTGSEWLSAGIGSPTSGFRQIYALSGILVSPVPEPGSLTLLVFGFVALGAIGLRRRRWSA